MDTFNARKFLMVTLLLGVQSLTSGCFSGGGGGGISSFFGAGSVISSLLNLGGSDGNNTDNFQFFSGSFSGDNEANGDGPLAGLPSDPTNLGLSAAGVLHNPEPGSFLLFATGLAGVAFSRRRQR